MTEQAVQTLEIAGVQTEFCVDTTIRMAHGLGYTCLMTPKTTSTLDNGHLTAAQIIQHHEAIWLPLLTFAFNKLRAFPKLFVHYVFLSYFMLV